MLQANYILQDRAMCAGALRGVALQCKVDESGELAWDLEWLTSGASIVVEKSMLPLGLKVKLCILGLPPWAPYRLR